MATRKRKQKIAPPVAALVFEALHPPKLAIVTPARDRRVSALSKGIESLRAWETGDLHEAADLLGDASTEAERAGRVLEARYLEHLSDTYRQLGYGSMYREWASSKGFFDDTTSDAEKMEECHARARDLLELARGVYRCAEHEANGPVRVVRAGDLAALLADEPGASVVVPGGHVYRSANEGALVLEYDAGGWSHARHDPKRVTTIDALVRALPDEEATPVRVRILVDDKTLPLFA